MNIKTGSIKTGSKCVKCNKKGTEGSMQHPYCKKHFKDVWNNDYNKYGKWLDEEHRTGD